MEPIALRVDNLIRLPCGARSPILDSVSCRLRISDGFHKRNCCRPDWALVWEYKGSYWQWRIHVASDALSNLVRYIMSLIVRHGSFAEGSEAFIATELFLLHESVVIGSDTCSQIKIEIENI